MDGRWVIERMDDRWLVEVRSFGGWIDGWIDFDGWLIVITSNSSLFFYYVLIHILTVIFIYI
jgi:hypothetical protein